jgi:cytochrome b
MVELKRVYVWDSGVRAFHWLLVGCLLGSWLTAEYGVLDLEWHFRFGYAALGLIVFRVLWGFLGNQHARFASFVRSPRVGFRYARELMKPDHAPQPGHNPLGGWSVIALLLVVAIQAITGLMSTDDIFLDGPLAKYVSTDTVSLMTRIHAININVLYALIALHLSAVLFHVVIKREALIRAMFSGYQRVVKTATDASPTAWARLLGCALVGLTLTVTLNWID